jgi:hypothetical protein
VPLPVGFSITLVASAAGNRAVCDVYGDRHLPYAASVLSSLTSASQVSSNLADYHIFSCYGDGSAKAPTYANQSCTLDLDISKLSSDIIGTGSSGPADNTPSNVANYVQGLAGYAVFGFVMAILCILGSAFFMFGRLCCCCIRGGECRPWLAAWCAVWAASTSRAAAL